MSGARARALVVLVAVAVVVVVIIVVAVAVVTDIALISEIFKVTERFAAALRETLGLGNRESLPIDWNLVLLLVTKLLRHTVYIQS